jgi:hypothetical protein
MEFAVKALVMSLEWLSSTRKKTNSGIMQWRAIRRISTERPPQHKGIKRFASNCES